jgi:hypothetical protein
MKVPSGLKNLFLGLVAIGSTATGLVVRAPMALAQLDQKASSPSPRVCAPSRMEGSVGLTPVFSGEMPNAQLETSVRLGYQQFYRDHQDAAASATLREARTQASAAKNTCAEALSVFALGVIAENSSFNDAPELLEAALRLFNQLDSTEGVARVHFALGGVYIIQSKAAQSNWPARSFEPDCLLV